MIISGPHQVCLILPCVIQLSDSCYQSHSFNFEYRITEHTQPTTVARISPSGFYCASGDVSGTVRIWDIAGTDQTLKLETKALGGKVNDLAWDGESKRMIAVGDGRERFGSAFFVDGGSRQVLAG